MKNNKIGLLIIASAIIWGAVIIGCSLVLKETEYKEEINRIVLGGVIFHLLFIWAPMGTEFRRRSQQNNQRAKL